MSSNPRIKTSLILIKRAHIVTSQGIVMAVAIINIPKKIETYLEKNKKIKVWTSKSQLGKKILRKDKRRLIYKILEDLLQKILCHTHQN